MGKTEIFYYQARNSIDRIKKGDIVLIDPRPEITDESIVLIATNLTLQGFDPTMTDSVIGKVVSVFVCQT